MNSIILQASGGGFGSFLPLLLIMVVIYFFMIRPQMKKQKDEKKFREAIAKGSRVVTHSGMHGKIVEISDNHIQLEVHNGIRIKMEKSAISKELSAQYAPKENKEEKKEDKK
jgi:preprotein translocase subunit YajC